MATLLVYPFVYRAKGPDNEGQVSTVCCVNGMIMRMSRASEEVYLPFPKILMKVKLSSRIFDPLRKFEFFCVHHSERRGRGGMRWGVTSLVV